MLDNNNNEILFDPSNVVIPQGWQVLSHGTQFSSWSSSIPGRSAQDLKLNHQIVVGNTLDGGLACVDENKSNLARVYAGTESPVLFRVLVPSDLANLDIKIADDAWRFLNPKNVNFKGFLVPTGTSLVKISEHITEGTKEPSVIWYVPEQFHNLFILDLKKMENNKTKSVDLSIDVPELNRDDSFGAVVSEPEEKAVSNQKEIPDDYYENLEEQQQELIDAEIQAEEAKAAKRAKDKEKAKKRDKANFERAEAEHAKQIEEANELRRRSEQSQNSIYDYVPGDQNTTQTENPVLETPSETVVDDFSVQKPNDAPAYEGVSQGVRSASYSSEDITPKRSEDDSSSSYSPSENAKPHISEDVRNEYSEPGYSSPQTGSEPNSATNTIAPDRFEDPKRQYASEAEARRQQLIDDVLEAEKIVQQEDSKEYQAKLQEEALQRQEQSKNYESFGHFGIDFSGHDDHSAFSSISKGVSSFETPATHKGKSQSSQISFEDFKQCESDFLASRSAFRDSTGEVPEHIALKYKNDSDRYFDLMRRIDQGSVVVAQPREPIIPKYNKDGFQSSTSNQLSESRGKAVGSSSNSKSDSAQIVSGAGNVSAGGNKNQVLRGSETFRTAQNLQTGDAPTPRSVAGLKNPPKSAVDLSPLFFTDERFKALKRLAHNSGHASYRIGEAMKYQVLHSAYTEETGTGRSVSTFGRGLGDASAVFDLVVGGSGKQEAAKIWSKHTAIENNTKPHGIDKQAVKDLGKLDVKSIDKKLKETLSTSDVAKLRNKFGDAADLTVSNAVGTKNGKIGKNFVFRSDGMVAVRVSEGKIGALRNKSTNLKYEIRALQAKGSSLSQVERKRYIDLVNKKKKIDLELRNTVSATNIRHQKETWYRQINAMSPKKLERELNKLEKQLKAGVKLNKIQKMQLTTLRERKALLDMRQKLAGRSFGRRTQALFSITGRHLDKLTRESGDDKIGTMMSMMNGIQSASRFATNRYVVGAVKWSVKTAFYPIKLAARLAKKVDRKLGVSQAINRQASQAVHETQSKIVHSKPVKKIQTSVSRKVNQAKKKYDQSDLKTVVNKTKSGVSKTKKGAKAVRDAFNKFNNNKFVKAGKSIISAPFKGLKLINAALQKIKAVILKYVLIPVSVFLLVAMIISMSTTLISSLGGTVFCGNTSSDDGRIDLTQYINSLNDKQKAINQTVATHKNNTEANGGDYRRVYVNYLGGANGNNYYEILSMTAVYFQQDFSSDTAVTNYMTSMFDASNYITTEISDIYYCSGCEDRDYHCYDALDKYATDGRKDLYAASDHSGEKMVGKRDSAQKGCVKSKLYSCMTKGHGTYNANGCSRHNNGKAMESPGKCTNYRQEIANPVRDPNEAIEYVYVCRGHCSGQHYDYSCPGHTEKICKGHRDLYVNVVCLGFDKIFSVDPNTTAGVDLGNYEQGDLIGTFNISYYCTEKHAHICNDAAPGTNDDGKTASGTIATAGRTIAVDPDVIPLGTAVVINGHTYIAEDTGGAISGNRIDIAVSSHQEALTLGRDAYKVYKAVESEDSETVEAQRAMITYRDLAKNSISEHLLSEKLILQAFGQAKEPEIVWTHNRVNADDEQSFAEKLQNYDDEHKNEPFSNAELNTFEYVKMSSNDLEALAKKRDDKDHSEQSSYQIITEVLIPYDKKHPDVYINDPEEDSEGSGDSTVQIYFDGWNEENKNWAKDIKANFSSDIYAGLDKIVSGSASNAVSLEGVTIQGSKIEVVYYSQHDPRWANLPVRDDYLSGTISKAGCGPTSMAIVVSSLTENLIDPPGMCAKYGKNYYSPGQGSYWSIVAGISSDYGLSCTEMSYSNVQGVIDSLKDGKLVVALVGSGGAGYTGNGYYKGGGHFLVICGVTDDGKFLLADCNNPAVSTSGTGVDMQYFMDSGIKTWWAVGK